MRIQFRRDVIQNAPIPDNEAERLKSLHSLNLLDTPFEQRFDCITKITKTLFNVPICTLTLVDDKREWFKSQIGLSCTQSSRDKSFCGHAVLESGLFCINDTLLDNRFKDNPMVTAEPPIRFYAGQSISGPGGYKVGVLCIKDHVPRSFNKEEIQQLQYLAQWAEVELNNKDLAEAVRERKRNQELLERMVKELKNTHKQLSDTQDSLLQTEKMASIGQLAAGVAHEINNPIGFVNSNLQSLSEYLKYYNQIIELYLKYIQLKNDNNTDECKITEQLLNEKTTEMDLSFIHSDAQNLIHECNDGLNRVNKIVGSLKSFSHTSSEECVPSSIQNIIETALELTHNELKYKCQLHTDLNAHSTILCHPLEISQVIINLLINASHAIEKEGNVYVNSYEDEQYVYIVVKDDGSGMDKKTKIRAFDPFYTTKPVGKGTGLGLSISYEIIVNKHKGLLEIDSEPNKGTSFKISLPKEIPAQTK